MSERTNISILITLLCLWSCVKKEGQTTRESSAATRPNIIFIMADDHAEKAISAYGHDLIETPNIDRLAKEGMLFRNSFVTNSICAPSRAAILTGKFSHINGKRDNLDVFDGDQETFPKLLRRAGYTTAMIGKWHLKSTPQGFDEWNILIGQGNYYSPRFVSGSDTTRVDGYVTDVITDYVLDFLNRRDTKQPFCLFYHHKAPHRNWMPNVSDLHLYADENLPLPANFFDQYNNRQAAEAADMRIADMFLSADMKLMPDDYDSESGTGGNDHYDAERAWKANYNRMNEKQREAWDAHYMPLNKAFAESKLTGKELAEWKYQRYMKDYLRCIKSVDDNVGRVLGHLDKSGLAENTIVVYTSDQGFYLGEHGWYDKRFMYEESMRTPLIVRYPKEIKAGTVAKQLVQNIDHAATFLDFAGIDIPGEVQGKSLRPVMLDPDHAPFREALYYHYYEGLKGWHSVKKHYGVRTERYKLIHFYHDIDTWELYDLKNDSEEMNNLYNTEGYRDIREDLHQKLKKLKIKYTDIDSNKTKVYNRE
ncbi:sulfatase [Fulvivirga sp. M361]|uniref:sulfatase family protein n=1 Tax=Fulvivirga sp. M361 TaxID=2594266 RepID=UPI00117B2DD6|nr:sulfatase [Fulvivirga sp. M361]TRX60162.1 sulfatase [Fulvivirga sp. M361]